MFVVLVVGGPGGGFGGFLLRSRSYGFAITFTTNGKATKTTTRTTPNQKRKQVTKNQCLGRALLSFKHTEHQLEQPVRDLNLTALALADVMRKPTPDFLDKKHVTFDQCLDFLIFCQGNRRNNQEQPRKSQEKQKTMKS